MHFLPSLKVNKLMCMERKVYHPLLCYHGKFDALIELKYVRLFLINLDENL